MEPSHQQEGQDASGPNLKRKWANVTPDDQQTDIDNNPLFHGLDAGCLQQVLLRVRAGDLPALTQTCRRLRDMLDSRSFRSLRAQTEWSEVRVTAPRSLRTEQNANLSDDESEGSGFDTSGFCNYKADIIVDNQVAGSIECCLAKRTEGLFIRGNCKKLNLFFDDSGRCRAPSLKEALKNKRKKPLLLVKKIGWNDEYRGNNCSYVGAVALRSFLSQSRVKNRWSVCIYKPDYTSQCPEADKKRICSLNEILEFENELEIQDMRCCFRAGFREIPEAVVNQASRHVFATPAFLKNPIISYDKANAIEIVKNPNDIQAPTGVNGEFHVFVESSCRSKRIHLYDIKTSTGDNLLEALPRKIDFQILSICVDYSRDDLLQEISGRKAKLRVLREDVRRGLNSGMERSKVDALKAAREAIETFLDPCDEPAFGETDSTSLRILQEESKAEPLPEEEVHMFEALANAIGRSLKTYEVALQEHGREPDVARPILEAVIRPQLEAEAALRAAKAESKLASLRLNFDEEIARFVNQKGASIHQSFVVHVCAEYGDVEFLDKLMLLVSEEERHAAVNQLNNFGVTPLMAGAEIEFFRAPHRRMIEKLIYYGAVKDTIDKAGESALGKFRKGSQLQQDSVASLGFSLPRGASDPLVEAILMPSFGATAADDMYLALPSDGENINNEESDSDSDESLT